MDPGAQPHRFGHQEDVLDQQVGLELGAHRPDGAERQLDVLVEEAVLDPFLGAGRPVEVAIVDDVRPCARRLGQQVHHAVDVLMREVDDRKQQGRARQVGQEAIGIEVGREVALAARHVDALIEELHLGHFRPLHQQGGIEGIAVYRRQLAQEIGAAVVDQEEGRPLGVVRAAGGAADHVDVGLGHDRRAADGIVERPVGHAEPGAAGRRNRASPPQAAKAAPADGDSRSSWSRRRHRCRGSRGGYGGATSSRSAIAFFNASRPRVP